MLSDSENRSYATPPPWEEQATGFERARDEANSLKNLFKQLGNDASTLMREEVQLAKIEFRKESRALASDLVKVGIALGLALLGTFALTAFLIIALGQLLDENYWLSSLVVGAVFLLIGGLMARTATKNMKERSPLLNDTTQTLREDKQWVREEMQSVKRELRS